MREKFYRFMIGRNGADQLSRFLTYVALALIVLNLFVGSTVLWLLGLAALVWAYFRMFSKNVARRREENGKYLQLQYKLTQRFRDWRDRQKQRRDYVFFRCPSCKAMLRVPRGKGRIRVTCRKCGNAFEKKT
ncbi:MAG: hypothetical protein LUF77_00475 [Oscillospiraceae bacterium]|nr:hypothetical protein [Oscillospiraceae bacterium]MCD7933788.1 hypothetical protein [Oscillospiraceae bacterium]